MPTEDLYNAGNFGSGAEPVYVGGGSSWANWSLIDGLSRAQFETQENPDDTVAQLEVRPGTTEKEMQIEGVASSLPMIIGTVEFKPFFRSLYSDGEAPRSGMRDLRANPNKTDQVYLLDTQMLMKDSQDKMIKKIIEKITGYDFEKLSEDLDKYFFKAGPNYSVPGWMLNSPPRSTGQGGVKSTDNPLGLPEGISGVDKQRSDRTGMYSDGSRRNIPR